LKGIASSPVVISAKNATFFIPACLLGMTNSILKKPIFIPVLIALLALSSTFLQAQQVHPIVADFSGISVRNAIRINWTIIGGNTCNGTLIQRSPDGNSFETIGEIAGICGSPDVDVPYVFIDENPEANQTNYYRLELGSQGFTTLLTVDFFPLNDDGYSLILDNISSKATIYFNNPNQLTTAFELFTLDGKIKATDETTDSKIIIHLEGLPAQLFILSISNTAGGFTVKIPNF
jgi:hypothetical protein